MAYPYYDPNNQQNPYPGQQPYTAPRTQPPQTQQSQMPVPIAQQPFTMPTGARGDVVEKLSQQFGGMPALSMDAAKRTQFLQALQRDPRFAGASLSGTNGELLRLPDGTVVDYQGNTGANSKFAWSIVSPGSQFGKAGGPGGNYGGYTYDGKGGRVATPGAVPGGSASGSRTTSTVKATSKPGQLDPALAGKSKALWDMLMQRATQGTAINGNDPNIQQQVQPFAAAQERARRQSESESAERLSARNLADSGAMDVERRIASERAGQATGMFQGELVGRELASRRQEIQEALSGLGGILSNEQELALRQKLAELDATLQREGYGVQRENLGMQRDLANAQLAQRGYEYNTDQSLNWAQFNWMQDPNNPVYWR
jgi:hypothetical protein